MLLQETGKCLAGELSTLVGVEDIWQSSLERFLQSIKREVNLVPYELPGQLERAIADFVDYYNYRRYHKALGNVTPADVLCGRREQILERRKEVQIQTINRRRDYNKGLRELVNAV